MGIAKTFLTLSKKFNHSSENLKKQKKKHSQNIFSDVEMVIFIAFIIFNNKMNNFRIFVRIIFDFF